MEDRRGVQLHQTKLGETYTHRREEIEKWEKFLGEYVALEQRLSDLADRTKHNVMVPIGPLAFIPGQLIHTNEVLVLLGENLFAERSTAQAISIIKRRQDYVHANMTMLQHVLDDLHVRGACAKTELGDGEYDEYGNPIVEIREDLTAEDERLVELHRTARYVVPTTTPCIATPHVVQPRVRTAEEVKEARNIMRMLEEAEAEEARLSSEGVTAVTHHVNEDVKEHHDNQNVNEHVNQHVNEMTEKSMDKARADPPRAFTGGVVEKSSDVSHHHDISPVSEKPIKMSRFMAARHNRHE